MTAVKVYGTGSTPGTQLGTFGGIIKIFGTSFESVYAGSNVTSFYGAGTFTVTGTTANVTLTCSSTGPGPSSFVYPVTSATTVDVTSPGGGVHVGDYVHEDVGGRPASAPGWWRDLKPAAAVTVNPAATRLAAPLLQEARRPTPRP